jgi:hypothetical protein
MLNIIYTSEECHPSEDEVEMTIERLRLAIGLHGLPNRIKLYQNGDEDGNVHFEAHFSDWILFAKMEGYAWCVFANTISTHIPKLEKINWKQEGF